MSKKPRPPGAGLGPCPFPSWSLGRRSTLVCGCAQRCKVCGFPKHTAVHMHVMGESPGDPPYDHEFVPAKAIPSQDTPAEQGGKPEPKCTPTLTVCRRCESGLDRYPQCQMRAEQGGKQ